jgi:hypothetical protein
VRNVGAGRPGPGPLGLRGLGALCLRWERTHKVCAYIVFKIHPNTHCKGFRETPHYPLSGRQPSIRRIGLQRERLDELFRKTAAFQRTLR